MRTLRCYVAGPISKGDLRDNIHQARTAAVTLIKAGIAAFCPHLSAYFAGDTPEPNPCGLTHANFMTLDLPWVECADILLRLPGESKGADMEVQHANANGIPVLHSVEKVVEYARVVGSAAKPASAGHPGYLAVLDEMRALHVKKAADYGRGEDPLANLRGSAEFGIPAWIGVALRMNDKMHRVKSLCQNGTVKNEPIEDSFADLACYGALGLVLYREWKSKEDAKHAAGQGV